MKPATLNRYLAAIAAVFTWAIRRRIAPRNWVHPCRAIQLRPEGAGKTRFLTDDERDRLFAAAKASVWPKLYLLVLLGVTTGARKGELMALRWADVDLAQRVMHVARSKNNDPKVLPLVPAAVAELERFKGAPGALVFASTRVLSKPLSFEVHWAKALADAKIKDFRFHDLRHACASFLAQSGASLLSIADLLGHRQISVTRRYSHLASSDRQAMVDRVFGGLA
jgi:integrase